MCLAIVLFSLQRDQGSNQEALFLTNQSKFHQGGQPVITMQFSFDIYTKHPWGSQEKGSFKSNSADWCDGESWFLFQNFRHLLTRHLLNLQLFFLLESCFQKPLGTKTHMTHLKAGKTNNHVHTLWGLSKWMTTLESQRVYVRVRFRGKKI